MRKTTPHSGYLEGLLQRKESVKRSNSGKYNNCILFYNKNYLKREDDSTQNKSERVNEIIITPTALPVTITNEETSNKSLK